MYDVPGSILVAENSMIQQDEVLVWSSPSVEAIRMDPVKTHSWDESNSRELGAGWWVQPTEWGTAMVKMMRE